MSSCNLCSFNSLKKKHGRKLHVLKNENGWTTVYLKGEQPCIGQDHPKQLPDGTPIRFLASYMSIEGHDHSTSMAEDMIDDMLSRPYE